MVKTNEILSLAGKDVWVIGGAGYLGQATVELLLQAGAKVLCADLEQRAQDYAKSLGDENLSGDGLDVRDSNSIKQFVQKYAAERGTPHGLVVLTFGSTSKRFDDLTEEDFDNVNHVGLTSTFLLAREVGNLMVEAGGGSIVLFSSMYGSVSPNPAVYGSPMNPNPIEYGVGKAGIVQMTRYLAVHYGQKGVRCNCLSPGPFPSPQVKQNNPGFVDRLSEKVPMGRVGEQGEIAGAVAFFVSDASSFITGQNLFVDGGWTAW